MYQQTSHLVAKVSSLQVTRWGVLKVDQFELGQAEA